MKYIVSQITEKINASIKNNVNIFDGTLSWEASYTTITADAIRQAFIAALTQADEAFFLSSERKKKYYAKDTVERTLTTTFGLLSFKRRKYTHKTFGTTYYFIDDMLALHKYQRISNNAKSAILYDITQLKLSYEAACDKFGLSKTFAYKLIQSIDPSAYTPSLKEKISCDYLHIVADEDHVAVQDKANPRQRGMHNSYMLKHITLYTNLIKVGKRRNKLENRVTFSQFEGETTINFCDRINTFIYENYDIKHGTEGIFVYGDGANWIKTLANELGTTFILDQFHAMQALFKVCGGKNNTDVRNILEAYMRADMKSEFFQVIAALNPNMSESKQKQVNYLKNNWNFYQNNFKIPQALVCCAEGINSHYFASRLSSRPKGFCISNIHKLGALLPIACSHDNLKQFFTENLPQLTKKKAPKSTIRNFSKYLNDFTFVPIIANKKSGTSTLVHSLIS